MDPLETYTKVIYTWLYNVIRYLGFEAILKGDPLKPNIRMGLIFFVVVSFMITNTYTVIYYDFVTKLHCVFFLLVFTQVKYAFSFSD